MSLMKNNIIIKEKMFTKQIPGINVDVIYIKFTYQIYVLIYI